MGGYKVFDLSHNKSFLARVLHGWKY